MLFLQIEKKSPFSIRTVHINSSWISVHRALHDSSCPGSGSVKGIIGLFKKFSLGVATKHLVSGREGRGVN